MPPSITIPTLELRPDGDVAFVKIKQSGTKPSLKDFQTYLKKKTLPSLLTSYTYGSKKITFFGYTTGKDAEASQHQLPPPFESESPDLYGSILLVSHAAKVGWDEATPEAFSPSDYESFYEKACNGELEPEEDEKPEDDEENSEGEEVDEKEEDEGDALEDEEAEDEGGEDEEECGVTTVVGGAEEEEEEIIRPVKSRKAVKIDPAQVQFQFVNTLVAEAAVTNLALCQQRLITMSAFTNMLDKYCTEADIHELERGIFNASLLEAETRKIPKTWDHEIFRWIYSTIVKRVACNLNPESYVKNKRLIERWKEGEFTLDELGHWTPYELNPDNWKDLHDQQFRREKRSLEGNMAMATDRFRCSRCRQKMCTYYELQTRSADEPMTIFITCISCGKQWRQ